MGVLGRGLASLIPKRNAQAQEDFLERIDEMKFDEEQSIAISRPQIKRNEPEVKEEVAVNEPVAADVTEIEEGDVQAMPQKPLTTPLPFDPFAKMETSDDNDELEEKQAAKMRNDQSPMPNDHSNLNNQILPHPSDTAGEPLLGEERVSDVQAQGVPEAVHGRALHARTSPLPEVVVEAASAEPALQAAAVGEGWDRHEQNVQHIEVKDIRINPLQPRRTFDPQELAELAASIEQHGILQPLVVRRLDDEEGYELIAGERRLRSAKKLGWDKVPCVVRRDVKSDQSRLVFALIENIQRENLSPVEEAQAYKQLNEEYGLTHEEIGGRVGKSRVAVTNIVRMLQLPDEIQDGLTEGKITTGHAKAILMIPDEDKQIKFYRHLLDEGLTVRKAEIRARRIQRTMNLNDPMRRLSRGRHPLALKYSPELEDRYGYDANVRFLPEKNAFEVVFRANNDTEVNELVERLLGRTDLPVDVDKDVIDD